MAVRAMSWDISHMVVRPEKKAESEKRAKEIYRRLMAMHPLDPPMSNNAWAGKAGVNTSFFTNLGAGKKPASEPSIGNLRAVLEAAGSSIPEFFLKEARGRLVRAPSAQALESAIRDALPGLPRSADTRPGYLAEVVLNVLGLPSNRPAIQGEMASDHEEAAPPRVPTKRAGSARPRKSARS